MRHMTFTRTRVYLKEPFLLLGSGQEAERAREGHANNAKDGSKRVRNSLDRHTKRTHARHSAHQQPATLSPSSHLESRAVAEKRRPSLPGLLLRHPQLYTDLLSGSTGGPRASAKGGTGCDVADEANAAGMADLFTGHCRGARLTPVVGGECECRPASQRRRGNTRERQRVSCGRVVCIATTWY